MIKIFFFTVSLSSSIFLFAQQDPGAKKILDELSENIKTYKTIKAEFKYSLENLQDKVSESYNGKIIIKGNKYKLNLMGAIIFFDGKTTWNYLQEENEVNISEPDNENDNLLSDPSKLFTIYNNNFKYKLFGEQIIDGKPCPEIDLYPLDLGKNYSRVRILVNNSKNQIISFKVFGKDGNRYTIEITSFTPNTNIDDNSFLFNEKDYPNIEVIDMR